ncbi:MAG: hypothetical protein JWM52_638 [Candidatus Saccharibacteria bacterium]|nr:hypothetical protein [Candidatus Saccharibacteria bacterium]
MKNIDITSFFKKFSQAIARFHLTLFIVFIVAGLGTAVLFLNSILTDTAGGDTYTSPITPGTIDQATLERINQLHTSDEALPPSTLPTGRINPFSE